MKTNNTEPKPAKTFKDLSKLKSKAEIGTDKSLKWFCITSNCNLYATGDFDLLAADEEEAERRAKEILDGLHFTVNARLLDGLVLSMQLHPDNVETEVVEISESSDPHDSTGADAMLNRTKIEAEIGAMILAGMESLSIPENGRRENRENIHAGMRDEMGHHLFQYLWELYLVLHPEQAVTER